MIRQVVVIVLVGKRELQGVTEFCNLGKLEEWTELAEEVSSFEEDGSERCGHAAI